MSALGARLGGSPPPAAGDADAAAGRPMRLVLQLSGTSLAGLAPRRGAAPDFFATVECRGDNTRDSWTSLGKTEVVYNRPNPAWATSVTLEYSFGAAQLLRFRVLRLSTPGKREVVGEVQCTVAHILLADSLVRTERLRAPSERGGMTQTTPAPTLTIRAEEERGDLGDSVTLQFAASNLRRGRKPFYTLMRQNAADHGFSPVKFSEVHKSFDWKAENTFQPISIPLAKLVNGDMHRTLRIEFSEYDRKGQHYRGGHADFTLASISASKTLTLKKTKKNSPKINAGTVRIVKFHISNSYTFLDYISAGVNINAVVAIDMSSTNGDPQDPRSLQYNARQSPNEYVRALREVGSVLAEYDTDKKFPAYGFSACLPPSFDSMSYCFALSGLGSRPDCEGIDGVVDAYYAALDNVAPHAPCMLNHVMQYAVEIAREQDLRSEHSTYTVLLLITDGDYVDQQHVADTICAAVDLPLSIVIVGVGEPEFPLLDELDGDDVRLCSSRGIPAARDIVQVVHFRRHRDNPTALARETLAEIPAQLVSYMRAQGLRPADISAIHRRVPPSPPTTPGSARQDSTPPPASAKLPPTPDPPSLKDDMTFAIPMLHPSPPSEMSHFSEPASFGSNSNLLPPTGHRPPPSDHYHSPPFPPADSQPTGGSFMTMQTLPANMFLQTQQHHVQPPPHGQQPHAVQQPHVSRPMQAPLQTPGVQLTPQQTLPHTPQQRFFAQQPGPPPISVGFSHHHGPPPHHGHPQQGHLQGPLHHHPEHPAPDNGLHYLQNPMHREA